jgi:hypothetical protein
LPMSLPKEVLVVLLQTPGCSEDSLCLRFDLSRYRLHRVFRNIRRSLDSHKALVAEDGRGVWIVELDESRCLGLDWVGSSDGYVQCTLESEFPDHRCYYHSKYEDLELVAFNRRLAFLLASAEPSVRSLSCLSMIVLEELSDSLSVVVPKTYADSQKKRRLVKELRGALLFRTAKERMKIDSRPNWIPPELWERLNRGPKNLNDFLLKEHFEILELSFEASREEVLNAWRKLARIFHPDVTGDDGDRMKLINKAKERIFQVRKWD